MSDNNAMLKKLLEQEVALKKKIREARKQEEKRKAQIQANKAKIIGMAVLAEIETDQTFSQSLQPVIDRHIRNSKDRKMLGLPPLETPDSSTNDNCPEGGNGVVTDKTEINQCYEEQKQAVETKAFQKE